MTNPTASPQATPPLDAAAPPTTSRDRNIAVVCLALLLIGMPVGWLPGSTSDVVGMIVIGLVVIAIGAALLLWLVPRERLVPERASRSALILGILSILACGIFWTGLPFAIGASALALGLSQRESVAAGRGMATAAVVLGAIAVLASFVVLLIG